MQAIVSRWRKTRRVPTSTPVTTQEPQSAGGSEELPRSVGGASFCGVVPNVSCKQACERHARNGTIVINAGPRGNLSFSRCSKRIQADLFEKNLQDRYKNSSLNGMVLEAPLMSWEW
jgi:hypothetical protein